jgi:hypothetical protein
MEQLSRALKESKFYVVYVIVNIKYPSKLSQFTGRRLGPYRYTLDPLAPFGTALSSFKP